jgi:hypothetical protein
VYRQQKPSFSGIFWGVNGNRERIQRYGFGWVEVSSPVLCIFPVFPVLLIGACVFIGRILRTENLEFAGFSEYNRGIDGIDVVIRCLATIEAGTEFREELR